jgi:hypothetical protein
VADKRRDEDTHAVQQHERNYGAELANNTLHAFASGKGERGQTTMQTAPRAHTCSLRETVVISAALA